MSWEQFRQNVQRKLCDASKVSSIEYVAEVYATEYDLCMKRGGTIPDKIPIVKGNVDGMKAAFIQALKTGLTYTSTYDLTGAMGAGVKIYWTGATLLTPTPPLITAQQVAAGGVINVVANTNNVTSPGEWTNTNETVKTTSPNTDNTSPTTDNNAKKILIVGDSISVDLPSTWAYQWKKLNSNVEILAIGGKQLTIWMKPNLETRLKQTKYNRVFILGGVNDCWSGKKAATILTALQSMVETIKATGAEAVVVTGYDAEKDMDVKKMPDDDEKIDKPSLAEYQKFQSLIGGTIKNAKIVPKVSIGVLPDGFHPSSKQALALLNHIQKY